MRRAAILVEMIVALAAVLADTTAAAQTMAARVHHTAHLAARLTRHHTAVLRGPLFVDRHMAVVLYNAAALAVAWARISTLNVL